MPSHHSLKWAKSSSMPMMEFEGGFAPGKEHELNKYQTLIAPRKYSLSEYITNLKRSVIAFNTPAVQHCLGWKLAEYLALGKAIISTPLTRTLPAPLEHGKHIHYVNGDPEEIRSAIMTISEDQSYRQQLERGAREYFMQYLHPRSVIRRIVRQANQDSGTFRMVGL